MLQLSNAFGRKPDVAVTDKSDLASHLRVRRAESHEFAIPRAQTATERASFGDKTGCVGTNARFGSLADIRAAAGLVRYQ